MYQNAFLSDILRPSAPPPLRPLNRYRVYDLIVTKRDSSVLLSLLRVWRLIQVGDVTLFLHGLIKKIRSVLGTHRLQNLMSKSHASFDAGSDRCVRC